MQLNIENISKAGGFSGGPVKRVVEWSVGEKDYKADVWIRPMSYQTAVKDIEAVNKGADLIAYRIASCVCHEDGSPVFRVSDVTGLDDNGFPVMVENSSGEMVERGPLCKSLSDSLITLLSEVSGLGKKKQKEK